MRKMPKSVVFVSQHYEEAAMTTERFERQTLVSIIDRALGMMDEPSDWRDSLRRQRAEIVSLINPNQERDLSYAFDLPGERWGRDDA